MNSVTPELSRVLKHELAHSFINQVSGGRCPQWLNEGIAQALEPKSLSSRGRRLAELFPIPAPAGLGEIGAEIEERLAAHAALLRRWLDALQRQAAATP